MEIPPIWGCTEKKLDLYKVNRCENMRQLTPREIDLLIHGANSLASSWHLRALKKELKNDPEVIEAGKKYGRKV